MTGILAESADAVRPEERLVSVEPSPRANPLDVVFQNPWARLVFWLFWATYFTVFWFILGPGSRAAANGTPLYAVSVVLGTSALVIAVPASATRRVPGHWFRVPSGERLLHRIVGVGFFGWLLDVSGWNRRVLDPRRAFSGRKAGLAALEQSVRAASVAHGICLSIHVLLAICALVTRFPWSAALWMLVPGVVVHLYPVLLQRSLMLRLQPLLERTRT
jgi:hypothetical protein